jgi:ankyrin repeat protein
MSVLLQPDQSGTVETGSPLAKYAAEHWVTHAQFETVSSSLQKAMGYLFDLDMPYFVAWLELYDIDTRPIQGSSSLHLFAVDQKTTPTPLYLAALCGFQDLVEQLVVKYRHHLSTRSGHYVTPLVAALAGRHFQTAKFLHQNGADVNVHGNGGDTALCSAAWCGDLEMVLELLNLKADVNDPGFDNWTAIHNASQGPDPTFSNTSYNNPQLSPDVIRLLLEHGADVNARVVHAGEDDDERRTPLHVAAERGRVEVVCLLLEHGANVGAEDDNGRTPLHDAADYRAIDPNYLTVEHHISGKVDVVRVLLEHGAKVGAEDNEGRTPLHMAAKYGEIKVVRVLLEHGAKVDAKDKKGRTPFQMASAWREDGIRGLLLEHGAKAVL